jgi:Tfp pilus assembly protein PilZ
MKIAIVSRPGEVLDAYKRLFDFEDIELIHLSAISELFQKLPDTALSGVMVDIQMVLKAGETEKNYLQTMEEIFPNVRTNWNPGMGLRALYSDSGKSAEDNMAAFLQDCRRFKPRALRRDKRMEKTFNVLYWPIDAPEQEAQRAYTLNVSYGGLFVCTCYAPSDANFVWVKLLEVDERPFKVLVKWTLPWGKGMRVPGFGGSFVELESGLAEKLEAALG